MQNYNIYFLGDCCGDNVNTNFCSACECLDPEYTTTTTTNCGSPHWKGDGYCDDNNNNEGCDYDGGKFLAFVLFMTIV